MHPLVARTIFRVHERLLGRKTFAIAEQLAKTQYWPRCSIESLRRRRLCRLIGSAYENTGYWRELMDSHGILPAGIRRPEDLRRLPLLEKETIRARKDDMVWPGEGPRVREARTSGSTSGALEFYTSSNREANITAARIRGHRWIGLDVGSKEVYFWASPVELGAHNCIKRVRDYLTNTPLSNASEITPPIVREYFARWRRFKVNCLFGYPSTFFLFVKMAERVGVDLTELRKAGLRAICTTAEILDRPVRRIIQDAFGVDVYDSYGLREAGLIGHECEHHTMHTNDEQLILETIDGHTLEPTDGEGELVVTNLYSQVMPIIRYRTGDIVTLSQRPCPCGRSLNRISVGAGRVHEFVITSDHRWVSSVAFSHICRAIGGIVKFQVLQDRLGEVRILLATDDTFPPDGIEQVGSAAREKLASDDKVFVELVDDIKPAPSGKYRPVISKVAQQMRQCWQFKAHQCQATGYEHVIQ